MTHGMELIRLVWNGSLRVRAWSWEVLNQSMRSAVKLAIRSGMELNADDWRAMHEELRAGRWMGDPEGLYALAVACGNSSAIASFEAWKGRKPFIADGVSDDRGLARGIIRRKRGRLAVGFWFDWDGRPVKVTSFAEDGSHLVACCYGKRPESPTCPTCRQTDWRKVEHSRETPERVYRITIADIRTARKARPVRQQEAGT